VILADPVPCPGVSGNISVEELSMTAAGGLSAVALLLAASAAGMLLTRTSRRYFGRSVH
jgi:hypothetical protein